MDEFLAEDFEITRAGRMSKERRPAVTEQALRVAANVYRPGIIGEAFIEAMRQKGAGKDEVEAAIRKALT